MTSSNIAFVIDHFRQLQTEQYEALGAAIGPDRQVIGIEIFSTVHPDYPFGTWTGNGFIHDQVFKDNVRGKVTLWSTALGIVRLCRTHRAQSVFLCHYERPYIFIASVILRLMGKRVLVMGDSKFDDYERSFWRECGKRLLYQPYQGALAASVRSADYIRFLGVPKPRIRLNYYAVALDQIRRRADHPPAPDGIAYTDRSFVCVARLIEKKNIATLIEAYAVYAMASKAPRKLVLCGSGPLDTVLRQRAAALSVSHLIDFRGNLNSIDIAATLARGLCLLLPSIEEQYGIAVVEGQAMGLPVILSTNPGARDHQVRSGVNGFVVEPDNVQGLAYFMGLLDADEQLWRRMSIQALHFAKQANVDQFVASVIDLTT